MRKENRSERLSKATRCLFSHLVRLCLLSPHSESKRSPRRRNINAEIDSTSPKAITIAAQAKLNDKNQSHIAKGENNCQSFIR